MNINISQPKKSNVSSKQSTPKVTITSSAKTQNNNKSPSSKKKSKKKSNKGKGGNKNKSKSSLKASEDPVVKQALLEACLPGGGRPIVWPSGTISNGVAIQDRTIINLISTGAYVHTGTDNLIYANFYFNLGSMVNCYEYASTYSSDVPTALSSYNCNFTTNVESGGTAPVLDCYSVCGASLVWRYTASLYQGAGQMIYTLFNPNNTNTFDTTNWPYWGGTTSGMVNSNNTTTTCPMVQSFTSVKVPIDIMQQALINNTKTASTGSFDSMFLHVAIVNPYTSATTYWGSFTLTQDIVAVPNARSTLIYSQRNLPKKDVNVLSLIHRCISGITTTGVGFQGEPQDLLFNPEGFSLPEEQKSSGSTKTAVTSMLL